MSCEFDREEETAELKAGARIGKAYGPEEKARRSECQARPFPAHLSSPHAALNAGMRDAEMKTLTWAHSGISRSVSGRWPQQN